MRARWGLIAAVFLGTVGSAKEPVYDKEQTGSWLARETMNLEIQAEVLGESFVGTMENTSTCASEWKFALGKGGELKQARVTYGDCGLREVVEMGPLGGEDKQTKDAFHELSATFTGALPGAQAVLSTSEELSPEDANRLNATFALARGGLVFPKRPNVDTDELTAFQNSIWGRVQADLPEVDPESLDFKFRQIWHGSAIMMVARVRIKPTPSDSLGVPGIMHGVYSAVYSATDGTVAQYLNLTVDVAPGNMSGMVVSSGTGHFTKFLGNVIYEQLAQEDAARMLHE